MSELLPWEVSVTVNGEEVLVIGHNHLSGDPNIDNYKPEVVAAGEHLLSFIGAPRTNVEKLVEAMGEARNLSFFSNAPDKSTLEKRLEDVNKILSKALAEHARTKESE